MNKIEFRVSTLSGETGVIEVEKSKHIRHKCKQYRFDKCLSKNNEYKSVESYRCIVPSCKGRMHVYFSNEDIRCINLIQAEHSCNSKLVEKHHEQQEILNKIIAKATETGKINQKEFDDEVKLFKEKYNDDLITMQALKKRLQRLKQPKDLKNKKASQQTAKSYLCEVIDVIVKKQISSTDTISASTAQNLLYLDYDGEKRQEDIEKLEFDDEKISLEEVDGIKIQQSDEIIPPTKPFQNDEISLDLPREPAIDNVPVEAYTNLAIETSDSVSVECLDTRKAADSDIVISQKNSKNQDESNLNLNVKEINLACLTELKYTLDMIPKNDSKDVHLDKKTVAVFDSSDLCGVGDVTEALSGDTDFILENLGVFKKNFNLFDNLDDYKKLMTHEKYNDNKRKINSDEDNHPQSIEKWTKYAEDAEFGDDSTIDPNIVLSIESYK